MSTSFSDDTRGYFLKPPEAEPTRQAVAQVPLGAERTKHPTTLPSSV